MSSRLPTNVVPTHYDLVVTTVALQPPFLYTGKVKISLTVNDPQSDQITLHCLEVSIADAHIGTIRNTSISYNVANESCTMEFPPGTILSASASASTSTLDLDIAFMGHLNDQMHGFYRSKYTAANGESKFMATTQHEPTDARRFFPCVDEPSAKATFQTSVNVPAGLTAISNTNIIETVTNSSSGSIFTKFGKTPKMSTYLHALVIGEFDNLSHANPTSNIITTVYTMPGKGEKGRFCLDCAWRCLDFQADQFGVAYPLPKSDLIAIPDFAAGAMENWGCVTYREAKVLTEKGQTSLATYKGIARTCCHELAHQWFGNLVTMDWWSGLFLNEGFARFMEFKSVNYLYPQWNIWDEFVQSVYSMALSLDSMESSHPIHVEVNHPDEINSIFDAISYAKGASLLRMCSSFVGDEIFMEGIRLYLSRHAYANTTPNDLWQAVEEVSNKPIKSLMAQWTTQIGYPVLTLDVSGTVTQRRFLASGANDDASLWKCPVSVLLSSGEVKPAVILADRSNDDLKSIVSKETSWFKLNSSETGFYLVNYTDKQWDELKKAVVPNNSSPLSSIDRLGLISDCFRLARAGYTSMSNALNLLSGFKTIEHLDEYVVWQTVAENLANSLSLAKGQPFFAKFQSFVWEMFATQHSILGWDEKSNTEADTNIAPFRGIVLSMMMKAGASTCVEEGNKRFNSYCDEGKPIAADNKSIIYRMALKHDEKNAKRKLLKLYRECDFPEEKIRLMSVLGEVQEQQHWNETMEWVLYSGEVRRQDIARPLQTLGGASPESAARGWSYLKRNFNELVAEFAGGQMWPSIVSTLCGGSKSAAVADEIQEFFELHEPGSAKKRVTQILERTRINSDRVQRDNLSLSKFFE